MRTSVPIFTATFVPWTVTSKFALVRPPMSEYSFTFFSFASSVYLMVRGKKRDLDALLD